MKEHPVREESRIVAAAERKMRDWAMDQEIKERAGAGPAASFPPEAIQTYVAISRECGAGGGEVAQLVGKRLGWQVLDRSLLDRVADRYHHSRMMLELVDETESNWVYDVLGTWMDRQIIPHEKYVSQLIRVVLAAARAEHCVFVGRGVQFVLPRDRGVLVRLVASERFRAERIAKLEGLAPADALRFVQQTDRGRAEFVSRFFHHDVNHAHLYDLVLNTERLGIAGAAEAVMAAVRV